MLALTSAICPSQRNIHNPLFQALRWGILCEGNKYLIWDYGEIDSQHNCNGVESKVCRGLCVLISMGEKQRILLTFSIPSGLK